MIHMILCGGSGTRLWPLSRECHPKQFISFLGARSLLQKTALGNESLCEGCVVVCSSEHYPIISRQFLECSFKPTHCILESIPKNTAAAACLGLQMVTPETIVLITPADHHIEYSEAYFAAVRQAQEYARQGSISIFGITPSRPETGFGYIETTDEGWVHRFHEKPDLKTAQQYLSQGCFYWNSGMVCAKADILLKAMQEYAPDILAASQTAYKKAETTADSTTSICRIPHEAMIEIPALSLDYALLEKMAQTANSTKKRAALRCVLGSFVWSDIGSFDSLFTHLPKDLAGNAVDANSFISIDSKNNLIMGGHRTISTIDVEDLVVVDTPDALLICRAGSTQKVRELVQQLKALQPHDV